MATLEEAQKCSKCNNPGDIGSRQPVAGQPGLSVIVITCRNQVCPWYDTGWPVQINADGTIPDAAPPGVARGSRQYAGFESKKELDEMIENVNNRAQAYQDWSGK